jgi:hypothetical protein
MLCGDLSVSPGCAKREHSLGSVDPIEAVRRVLGLGER